MRLFNHSYTPKVVVFSINLLLLKNVYLEFYTVVYRPIKLFTGHVYMWF